MFCLPYLADVLNKFHKQLPQPILSMLALQFTLLELLIQSDLPSIGDTYPMAN